MNAWQYGRRQGLFLNFILMQAIDTHVHFWKYSKTRLSETVQENKMMQQDYLPETLSLNLQRNGVSGILAVESEEKEVETRFLCELAATHPVILGVIGWIDPGAPDIEEKLAHFSAYPSIKGYRYDLSRAADTAAIHRGIAAFRQYNYSFDLLGSSVSSPDIKTLVAANAQQTFVLDNCGSPAADKPLSAAWSRQIEELAALPNLHCKLSGLLTLAKWKNWSPAQFYPFLDILFGAFGPDRLMFGSDWPYMLLSGMYVQWKSLLEKYMEPMLEEDREKIFSGNAVQVYGL